MLQRLSLFFDGSSPIKLLHMTKIDTLLELLYKIYLILSNQQPSSLPPAGTDDEPMTRQEVKDYLGISESTYKRKVKDGTLRPIKMPGGDRFYKHHLIEALGESKRKGRI